MTALAHRRADAEDLRLVISSWLDSYRTAHAAGLIPMHMWRRTMRPVMSEILARPTVEVIVAYHPGEDDRDSDLYGWIAIERGHRWPHVIYAYTKHAYRGLGVARGLMSAAGIDPADVFTYACKTGLVSDLAPKIPRARWKPLISRLPPPRQHAEAATAAA